MVAFFFDAHHPTAAFRGVRPKIQITPDDVVVAEHDRFQLRHVVSDSLRLIPRIDYIAWPHTRELARSMRQPGGHVAVSAFVVKVPEAELLVGDLRERFDETSRLGVPAHITVLFPFMSPHEITCAVVERAQAALMMVPAFSYTLDVVGRFAATVYLSPSPANPFIELTAVIATQFPAFPPYEGRHAGVIPHLAVLQGVVSEVASVAQELERRLDASSSIQATCTSVRLLENSAGSWREMHGGLKSELQHLSYKVLQCPTKLLHTSSFNLKNASPSQAYDCRM